MDEILTVAQKLGSLGFGTLLVIILWGSYKEVWVWGRQLKEAKQEGAEWKAIALRATGMAETLGQLAKTNVSSS